MNFLKLGSGAPLVSLCLLMIYNLLINCVWGGEWGAICNSVGRV